MAFFFTVIVSILAAQAWAAPAPENVPYILRRQTSITNEAGLSTALSSFSALPAASQSAGYMGMMSAIKPSPTPTDIAAAVTRLQTVASAHPSDWLGAGASVLLNGLTGASSFGSLISGFGACNSHTNSNPAPPSKVYPKSTSDAPFDIDENTLRSAIYFPSGFTHGKVPPALFIPGTASAACQVFNSNLGQLFTGSKYADPVYVNVPNNLLDDIQVNAEYIAYAINYVNAITKSNVSVLTWSQGSIATQWGLKYWPSTRKVVSDVVNVSPDYHGTIEVPIACPAGFPCSPAVLQQNYNSVFIQTLRNGGSGAFVPTTEVHSIYDEVVEPQSGSNPSANIGPGTGGSTNVQLQNVCSSTTPAGFPVFGHEGCLYNAITYAVAVDALQNPGSANIARSGAGGQCGNFAAPGLTLANIFAVEALLPIGGFNFITYGKKVTSEPAIKSYAQKDAP